MSSQRPADGSVVIYHNNCGHRFLRQLTIPASSKNGRPSSARFLSRQVCIVGRPLGHCTKVQYRSPQKCTNVARAMRYRLHTSLAAVALQIEHSSEGRWFKEKMNLNFRSIKRATGLLPVLLTGFLIVGCSQTAPS